MSAAAGDDVAPEEDADLLPHPAVANAVAVRTIAARTVRVLRRIAGPYAVT
jgi:hypothetical protein